MASGHGHRTRHIRRSSIEHGGMVGGVGRCGLVS